MYQSMPEWRSREIDALVGKSHVIEYDYQRDPDRFSTARADAAADRAQAAKQAVCPACHHTPCRCELGGEG
jgi:hypothetical protein